MQHIPESLVESADDTLQRISLLECELANLKGQLRDRGSSSPSLFQPTSQRATRGEVLPPYLHQLLLLSDSALPLGSFAFSSGLESFIAHRPKSISMTSEFLHFLDMSLTSMASGMIPFVTSAFYSPKRMESLDNDLDASMTCVVARRTSVAQGQALIGVWERSLSEGLNANQAAQTGLESFLRRSASTQSNGEVFGAQGINGHLAPLFGAVCAVLSIPIRQVLYMYLMNHVKTLLSAAVRASLLGPYQAQKLLAGERMQVSIHTLVQEAVNHPRIPAEAGQNVPMLDIWSGRHEIVYSRIFNS